MKVLLYQFHFENYSPWKESNNYNRYWEFSRQSCKKYAKKCNYDYLFDYKTDKTNWSPWYISEPHFEQFKAIEYLKNYDAVLYADTDILIKPNSPDIIKEYEKSNANIIVNSRIGNELLGHTDINQTLSFNTGVVLWYNQSKYLNNLYEYITVNKDFQWWEDLNNQDWFHGKLKSGYHNEERFLAIFLEVFGINFSHLHQKYNFKFRPRRKNILSNDIHFIHYQRDMKKYIKEHYNLIMEQ
jgi:hypothetical protein